MNPQPKKIRRRDPDYLAWIRTLPSCVSGKRENIEAHHVNKKGDGAVGLKADDRRVVPLTQEEHAEYHRIGRTAFELKFGTLLEYEIVAYNSVYSFTHHEKPKRELKRKPKLTHRVFTCTCSERHEIRQAKCGEDWFVCPRVGRIEL